MWGRLKWLNHSTLVGRVGGDLARRPGVQRRACNPFSPGGDLVNMTASLEPRSSLRRREAVALGYPSVGSISFHPALYPVRPVTKRPFPPPLVPQRASGMVLAGTFLSFSQLKVIPLSTAGGRADEICPRSKQGAQRTL